MNAQIRTEFPLILRSKPLNGNLDEGWGRVYLGYCVKGKGRLLGLYCEMHSGVPFRGWDMPRGLEGLVAFSQRFKTLITFRIINLKIVDFFYKDFVLMPPCLYAKKINVYYPLTLEFYFFIPFFYIFPSPSHGDWIWISECFKFNMFFF